MAAGSQPHLNPKEIAAYLAGETPDSRIGLVEEHLAECDSCRRELIEASSAHAGRWRASGILTAALPVAAAAILAAILLLPSNNQQTSDTGEFRLREVEAPNPPEISVIQPAFQDTVARDDLTFRWNSAGSDAFYRISILTQNGDVLWTTSSTDTVLVPPDSVVMPPGDFYFWYVDGLLPGAMTVTTGIQEFILAR